MKRNKWWRMSWMLLSLLMVFSSVVPAFTVYAEEDPAAADETVVAEEEATEEKEVIAWEDLTAEAVTEAAPEADDEVQVPEEAGNDGVSIKINNYEVSAQDYAHISQGFSSGYAVYDPDKKELTFYGDNANDPAVIGTSDIYGMIIVDQDLTIRGNVKAYRNPSTMGGLYGIWLKGSGHTLTLACKADIKTYQYGIYVEKEDSSLVIEEGADLKVSSDVQNQPAANFEGDAAIFDKGSFTVNGGTTNLYGDHLGLYCGETVFGGNAIMYIHPLNHFYKTEGIMSDFNKPLTINSGLIEISGEAKESAYYGYDFTMNGGSFNACGGLEDEYAFKVNNFTLNSGQMQILKNTNKGAALFIVNEGKINGGNLTIDGSTNTAAIATKNPVTFADRVEVTNPAGGKIAEKDFTFYSGKDTQYQVTYNTKYASVNSTGDIISDLTIQRKNLVEYDLYVGDLHINEDNCKNITTVKGGSASYDPETKTLYLNDVTGITGYRISNVDEYNQYKALITAFGGDFTISGNAVISSTDADVKFVFGYKTNINIGANLELNTAGNAIEIYGTDNKQQKLTIYDGSDISINVKGNESCGIRVVAPEATMIIPEDAIDAKLKIRANADEDGKPQNCNAKGIVLTDASAKDSVADIVAGSLDIVAGSNSICADFTKIGPNADLKLRSYENNLAIGLANSKTKIIFTDSEHTKIFEPANVVLSEYDEGKTCFNYTDTPDKRVNYVYVGVEKLSVSFNMCGHGDPIKKQIIKKHEGIVTKPADPVAAGYVFLGWYTDEACTVPFDFSKKIESDIVLYAKWSNKFSVSFNTCGKGDAVATQQVDYGKTANKPEDPKAEGFEFAGWYTDEECTTEFDFATPITADITLYAKWLTVYTVSFNMCGHGDPIEGQKVAEGKTVTKPADPKAEAYDFVGWYTEAACTNAYDFAAPVTANLDLYAKWDIAASAMNPIPEITANTKEIYLVKGQSFTLPEGKWISDMPKAVKITKKGTVLTAKKVTEQTKPATITLDGSSRSIKVYVSQPAYAKKKLSFSAGVKKQSLGFTYDKHLPVQWATSAPDVATVSQNGLVNAVAKGKATITAYINGKAYSCTVNVKEDNAVAERTLHLNLKKSKKVSIKGVKANKAEWSVSDNNIATVKKGKITAGQKAGTTTVTCKNTDGKTYKIIVTVEDPQIKTGQIEAAGKNKYKVTLAKAGAKAKVTFNNVVQPVIFKSSAGAKAYFDKEGNIVANGKGKATLKAKINGTTVSIKVTVSE